MRSVAEFNGIKHRDAMWVIDSMLDAGVLSAPQIVLALEAMRSDPRCPIPKPELAARIRRLGI